MINLFITDIDGCLLEAMKTPDWELLGQIKALNARSADDALIPPLTICTGRPMPYAEAVAQMMGIRRPLVFESACIFEPAAYRISVNGQVRTDIEQQITALKKWLKKEIISAHEGMTPEFTKQMDAGLIHPHKDVIQRALPRIRAFVHDHYQQFEVHDTDVSINIIPKMNNKGAGIKRLCRLLKIELAEVAYIGDSSGDIPGLKCVGKPYAPLNARDEVKEHAEVMPFASTKAVLAIYEQLIEENKQ